MRSGTLRSPHKSVRFVRPIKPLANSLSSYLRTPYPSAPISPTGQTGGGGQWPKDRDANDTNSRGRSLSLSPSIKRVQKPALLNLEYRPNESSITRAKKPPPLDLESRLSEDFWQSLSLQETAKSDDEPMMTALEYPESAVQYDHVLQSPGVPQPGATLDKIRDSLMSPGKKSNFGRIIRKDFTAPSPNDPFAAFPSFAAVLTMASSEGVTLWSR